MKVTERQSGNLTVSLAFVTFMNHNITTIVLLFPHLHLFLLILTKLKTGPRLTLVSGELLLNGHLTSIKRPVVSSREWPPNRSRFDCI